MEEENKMMMMVTNKVLKIKHILCDSNNNNYSEMELLRALESLQSIPISLDILQTTQIGRVVNDIKKKSESKKICQLARTLVTKWKTVVDEWVDKDNATTKNHPETSIEKVINKDGVEFVQKHVVFKCSNNVTFRLKYLSKKHQSPRDVVAEAQTTIMKMEQQEEKLLVTTNNKSDGVQKDKEFAFRAKLEASKRNLHDEYERIQKKQRTIKTVDFKDLPQDGAANFCQTKPRTRIVRQRMMTAGSNCFMNSNTIRGCRTRPASCT